MDSILAGVILGNLIVLALIQGILVAKLLTKW